MTSFDRGFIIYLMTEELKPKAVYTTKEAQDYLKVSPSTIKRLLKRGIIKANKVGGSYRILGQELLRLVSPKVEKRAINLYLRVKEKVKKTIEKW